MARFERTEDLLRLAMMMQTTSSGLSLYDIQEEFKVSRRTAERMRDSVVRLFPQIETFDGTDKIRRWKIPSNMTNLVSFTAEEVVELENLRKKLASEGNNQHSERINFLVNKIKVLNQKNLHKIETDIEALLEAEGYAVRQYPRFKVEKETLEVIRGAIKSFKKLQIQYLPKDKEQSDCIVYPYGLLYGEKHYLVAFSEPRQAMRLYNTARILDIKIIDEYYEKDENFSLTEYANNSFSIFQEDPYGVKLRFSKEVAHDVKNYHFHPTQQIEEEDDGSVTVKFTAGGSLSICWHVFRWGKFVEILEPMELKEIYLNLLQEAQSQYFFITIEDKPPAGSIYNLNNNNTEIPQQVQKNLD